MTYTSLKEHIECFLFNVKGFDQAHKYTPICSNAYWKMSRSELCLKKYAEVGTLH